MPVPALTNGPWTFSVNNIATGTDYGTTGQKIIFELKEALKAFAAWDVIASSDSVSVKNDGDADPDLWDDYTDVVKANAGTPHSWILLENSTTGEQLCFDVCTVNNARVDVWLSTTGSFAADGTTSNRPTDTESYRMFSVAHNMIDSSTKAAAVHAMISNDDKCTRWFVTFRYMDRLGSWFGCIEEIYGTPAVWTGNNKRVLFVINASNASSSDPQGQYPLATHFDSLRWWAYLKDATPYEGWNSAYASCECYKGFSSDQGDPFYRWDRVQEWNEGLPCSPIGIFRENVSRGGALGALKDIYLAPIYHETYSTYDGVTDREWIKFGGVLVPWNGVVPTYLEAGYS